MNKFIFISNLSNHLENFIAEKRACGYKYEFQSYLLDKFDKFIVENEFNDGFISKNAMEKWSLQSKSEGISYRNARISSVRQFSKYLVSIGINSYIAPQTHDTPSHAPYILNITELQQLLNQVDNYLPKGLKYLHQSVTCSVLFRLYISSGLRLSEPLRLKPEDVDLRSSYLIVRQSKGNKDRKVYISDDICQLCYKYDQLVSKVFLERDWFFISTNPTKPINKTSINYVFKSLWIKSGNYKQYGKNPTVHSLRHTYVVMKLNQWMDEGIDINTMMPYLAKQLGHSSIDGTYYYYHTTESYSCLVRKLDQSSSKIIKAVEFGEINSLVHSINNEQETLKCSKRKRKTNYSSLIPKVKLS
jgi:integrase